VKAWGFSGAAGKSPSPRRPPSASDLSPSPGGNTPVSPSRSSPKESGRWWSSSISEGLQSARLQKSSASPARRCGATAVRPCGSSGKDWAVSARAPAEGLRLRTALGFSVALGLRPIRRISIPPTHARPPLLRLRGLRVPRGSAHCAELPASPSRLRRLGLAPTPPPPCPCAVQGRSTALRTLC
jgi:hypothetical protein